MEILQIISKNKKAYTHRYYTTLLDINAIVLFKSLHFDLQKLSFSLFYFFT